MNERAPLDLMNILTIALVLYAWCMHTEGSGTGVSEASFSAAPRDIVHKIVMAQLKSDTPGACFNTLTSSKETYELWKDTAEFSLCRALKMYDPDLRKIDLALVARRCDLNAWQVFLEYKHDYPLLFSPRPGLRNGLWQSVYSNAMESMCLHVFKTLKLTDSEFPAQARDQIFPTMMRWAVELYDPETFEKFVNIRNPNALNRPLFKENELFAGIRAAVEVNRIDQLKVLLKLNYQTVPRSAVNIASFRYNRDALFMLLDKFKYRALISDPKTPWPIHAAVSHGDHELAELCMSLGSDNHPLPLQFAEAIRRDDMQMLELLSAYGGNYIHGGLFHAIAQNKLEMASYLISQGANLTYKHALALRFAVQQHMLKALRLLAPLATVGQLKTMEEMAADPIMEKAIRAIIRQKLYAQREIDDDSIEREVANMQID